jgi:hypothetical protein
LRSEPTQTQHDLHTNNTMSDSPSPSTEALPGETPGQTKSRLRRERLAAKSGASRLQQITALQGGPPKDLSEIEKDVPGMSPVVPPSRTLVSAPTTAGARLIASQSSRLFLLNSLRRHLVRQHQIQTRSISRSTTISLFPSPVYRHLLPLKATSLASRCQGKHQMPHKTP